MNRMKEEEEEEEEALVSELKLQLDDENLNLEQKLRLLNTGLHDVLSSAAVQRSRTDELTRVKARLYHSGVLNHCVLALSHPSMHRGVWSAAATLAQLTSSCCVGLDPGRHSDAFLRLLLPSVVDGLLSLAAGLARRAEAASLLRKVMDSVRWLLSAHTQLTDQVLSSVHYEQIQMCEDVSVSLLCVQLWTHLSSSCRDFLSRLGRDSVLLLLNEAVGQLALSSDPAVGGACVRLILLMANQLGLRLHALLLNFRGLDSLLDKDWRGRGFDQEVDQLIGIIQSEKDVMSPSQVRTEHVRAACVIQASWRSYQTRRRVKSLSRAASALQRRYRARRRQQEQQKEAQQWEEELKYQVSVRRQRARTEFHRKQRRLLQLLPPGKRLLLLLLLPVRPSCRTVVSVPARRGSRASWIAAGQTLHGNHADHTHQRAPRPRTCRVRTRSSRDQRLDDETTLSYRDVQNEAPPLSVVTVTVADSFLRPSGPVAARARDAHNAALQAGRRPFWRMLDEDGCGPAHLFQDLEEELGGLYLGGL
ncbi:IQ calmodulin-binding motif-containing protein 1-like [Mugil cephalus]|uniref:IQ calmodulin-binding motif-containing protein 1-like n=1 Tax=Mugil cephalus TaxID=48193 RepID=UPI001FB7A305|nr:IQ calmodulin-binding motif-containing protein 1-like [Mugil cephalus]